MQLINTPQENISILRLIISRQKIYDKPTMIRLQRLFEQ